MSMEALDLACVSANKHQLLKHKIFVSSVDTAVYSTADQAPLSLQCSMIVCLQPVQLEASAKVNTVVLVGRLL